MSGEDVMHDDTAEHENMNKQRHRRSAKQRREQQMRSNTRILLRMARGLMSIEQHRGNQLGQIGEALQKCIERELSGTPSAENTGVRQRMPICRHAIAGRCTWGDNCRFSHRGLSQPWDADVVPGTEWTGTEWSGTECHTTGCPGTEWTGAEGHEQSGSEQSGLEQSGLEHSGLDQGSQEQSGLGHDGLEQSAWEQSAQEQSAQKQSAQEQSAQLQSAKEQSDHDHDPEHDARMKEWLRQWMIGNNPGPPPERGSTGEMPDMEGQAVMLEGPMPDTESHSVMPAWNTGVMPNGVMPDYTGVMPDSVMPDGVMPDMESHGVMPDWNTGVMSDSVMPEGVMPDMESHGVMPDMESHGVMPAAEHKTDLSDTDDDESGTEAITWSHVESAARKIMHNHGTHIQLQTLRSMVEAELKIPPNSLMECLRELKTMQLKAKREAIT